MAISGGTFLLALTGLALTGFWLLPGGVLDLRRLAGGALQADLRPAYGSRTLYALLDAYGIRGRRWFGRMLQVDLVFPMLYAATIWMLAAEHGAMHRQAAVIAQVTGFAAAGFDELENLLLLSVLGSYPSRSPRVARSAGIMTLAKIISLTFSVGILASFAL